MASHRYSSIVDLHIVLRQDDAILLGKRQNTGFCDGFFHLPAGHLEKNETVLAGIMREATEELGISIPVENLRFILLLHQFSGEGRIAVFFEATSWKGTLENLEPDKCASLEWFQIQRLPENIVPYARFALEKYAAGEIFATFGWDAA